MKNTIRTFVAVETDEAVRGRAVQLMKTLDAAGAAVKWVERPNLHLTLKFLDEVPTREIVQVCQAVGRAAAEIEEFELEIRGAGAFPSASRPRTVWLGGGEGEEQMVALQERIEAAVAKLGFRKEPRRYQSHLTIGRVRGGSNPAMTELGKLIQQNADFQAGGFRVAEAVVFSSVLGPKGPTYEALFRAPLKTSG